MCYNKGKNVKITLKIINVLIITAICVGMFFIHDAIKKPSVSYLDNVTVFIKCETEEGTWVGSGVVVKITEDYTYIVTNKHVAPMEEQGNISVYNNENNYKKATVLKNSDYDEEDMSLIRVNGTLRNKIAVVGVRNPKKGERVFVSGNAGGLHSLYREGFIAKMDTFRMYVQLPVRGGDSGSGIIDKDGYLVGLVFALGLDYGYGIGGSLVLVPNHTVTYAMKGVQLTLFLKGEI